MSDPSHNIQILINKIQFTMRNYSRKRWIRCEKAKNSRKSKMRRSIERWLDATFESPPSCNIWIRIKHPFHRRQLNKETLVWMKLSWKTVNQLFLISTAVLYKLSHSLCWAFSKFNQLIQWAEIFLRQAIKRIMSKHNKYLTFDNFPKSRWTLFLITKL